MSKGQTTVIQFIIFFLIGFAVFISVGTFFRYQSDLFRQMILSSGINLTSSYLSSAVIAIVDSCKECDFVNLTIRTQNTSAGYPLDIAIVDSGLNISAPTTTESLATRIHNFLLYTLSASGSSSTFKPIILTFNRTNYNLTVE